MVESNEFKEAFDKVKSVDAGLSDEETEAVIMGVDLSNKPDFSIVDGVVVPRSYVDGFAQAYFENNPKRLTIMANRIKDISYDLNNEVPRLWIKSVEVGIVSMTKHYVTRGTELGTNTTTFIYVTKDSPEQKILSINNLGEVFHQ